MLGLKVLTTFFLALSVTSWAADPPPKKIEVVIGQDHIETLDFAPYTKVEVGNPSILDYRIAPQKRRLTLKGLKPSNSPTTVRVLNTVGDVKALYEVTVSETAKGKLVQKLKTFLGDIEGLEIKIKGGEVVLEGKIIVPDDLGRVFTIINRDEFKEVIFLVEVHPQAQVLIARKMQEEIRKQRMKQVTVRIVNGVYWLEGVVGSDGEKERAELIAMAYYPATLDSTARRERLVKTLKRDIIQNFIQVNKKSSPPSIPKLIKVTAQFVELTKDYNRLFGFKWIPLMNSTGGNISIGRGASGDLTSESSNTLSATISNLFPKLASARSAGHARVIQSGVIITQDKEKANIKKTNTIPFALGTGEFTRASSASASFDINVTPEIMPQEKVKLDIGISVSANFGTPPQTNTNSLKTKVVIKSKDSAAIGGMVINKTTTNFDKDPPFGEVQFNEGEGNVPLFSFLRSKNFTSSKTQFVVFVTPELIDSASEGTAEIKRKFRQRGR
ncbi:MAG: hypothetical protein CME61_02270 [Halobacteriovoraceae bacterium]|nr:hypothetical protein [Halobacteriovoraceae bacterium]